MFSVPFLSSRKTSSSRRNRSSGMSRRAFEPRRIRVEPLEDRRLLAVVSHWPADGTAADAVGSNDATLVSGADYSLGQIGQAFLFDGVDTDRACCGRPSQPGGDRLDDDRSMDRVDSFPDPGEGSGWIVFRGDERGGLDPYTMGVQSDRSLKFEINDAPGCRGDQHSDPGADFACRRRAGRRDGDAGIYVNGAQMRGVYDHQRSPLLPISTLPAIRASGSAFPFRTA